MPSLKVKLYFSSLGYILHLLTKIRGFLGGRCIVYGYRCKKTGKYLPRTRIGSTTILMEPQNLEIEDNVWINHYSRIDASGGLFIGEGCQIGFGCGIITHSSHISQRLMGMAYMETEIDKRPGYIHKKTSIGKYTFIGSGSYILPGISIGKGCVIGVNAVVTKDVPDFAVVAGVPAKIIGDTRKQDEQFLSDDNIMKTYYNTQM